MTAAGSQAAAGDAGLLPASDTGLLIDRYELTMAAAYLARDMNEPAVFELFVRRLPERRNWLMAAGLGPSLTLVASLSFGPAALEYLSRIGFGDPLLDYLERFRFTGDVDAMAEGTVFFAGEPVLRVTAPRIEAQILETLLLNQLNFQTAIATKAARLVVAAGSGAGPAGRIVDFSARRDHGIDAAIKAARSAAIAGAAGTSNLAAAAIYGIPPVGTMAHSYVLSFPDEQEAFRAFLRELPAQAVLLVDTYDTLTGVGRAIAASRETGVPLAGVRLDSGDLLELAGATRSLLDAAGMHGTEIVASGNLDEQRIADLARAGAPIDMWGVGTDLGTSRDAPVVDGVYKLVADMRDGRWRGVAKRSEGKASEPGAKQVFRRYAGGRMRGDVIAPAGEAHPGQALVRPVMRAGRIVHAETLAQMRERAAAQIAALPAPLLGLDPVPVAHAYPVERRLPRGGNGT